MQSTKRLELEYRIYLRIMHNTFAQFMPIMQKLEEMFPGARMSNDECTTENFPVEPEQLNKLRAEGYLLVEVPGRGAHICVRSYPIRIPVEDVPSDKMIEAVHTVAQFAVVRVVEEFLTDVHAV